MAVKELLYSIFFITINAQDLEVNLTVEYYENLIEINTEEAFSYPLPENAYEYKPLNDKAAAYYDVFDYIVVGAGSAGSVIATRLSEDPELRILLLEAGDRESAFSDIPGYMAYLQGLRFNWNYVTTPQNTSCLGMVNRECPMARGRVVGGSSAINALMYVRGNSYDYDSWEKLGNKGWSFKDVLPYFIRSENSQIDGDPGYHGKGGLLNVEYHRPYSPELYAYIEGNLELGRRVVDYNGKDQLGVARTQLNNLYGRRHSTGRAFIPRAASRDNLVILTNSFVTKILINKRKEAYGVQFSSNRTLYSALATREVILSAGSIGSPQLLMLSGIGPRAHLKQHRIPVIKDLAVGQNLQDHPTFYGLFFTCNYSEPVTSDSEDIINYLNNYGSYTIAGNSQGLGFFQTNLTNIKGVPDVEIIVVPSNSTGSITQRVYHYSDETYNTVFPSLNNVQHFSFYLMLLHPRSRGSITLRSADPFDYPLIDSNYLSDAAGIDIETMYLGVQIALEIIDTNAYRKINAALHNATLPACRQYQYLSRAYWYCQLRQLTMHIYHSSSTCTMGPNPEKGAVVNHELKVHGIKRLRVADTSIIPLVTSGHLNAAAIMIGEKLADMVRKKS